jgi:hypothetical protein
MPSLWEIPRYTTQKVILQFIHRHEAAIIRTAMPRLWLPVLVFLATLASSSQAPSSTAEIKSPDLNLVLQRLEEVQHQDPARSRPYDLRREYKVFRGYDRQPISEVMAQINFAPPGMKTYKIIQAQGNSRGEKMVRELLDRETESAKKGLGSEITRTNYDFVFRFVRRIHGLVSALVTCQEHDRAQVR